jgi:hypothetical protein
MALIDTGERNLIVTLALVVLVLAIAYIFLIRNPRFKDEKSSS